MRKTIAMPALAAALLGLAACGPNQAELEQSIREFYENEGHEDIEVTLNADDGGGFTGHATYTEAGTGADRRVECVVEPPEDNQAQWECRPGVAEMEAAIVEGYSERGAINARAELSEADEDGAMTGSVTFTEPQSGQQMTHACAVETTGGQVAWNCAP